MAHVKAKTHQIGREMGNSAIVKIEGMVKMSTRFGAHDHSPISNKKRKNRHEKYRGAEAEEGVWNRGVKTLYNGSIKLPMKASPLSPRREACISRAIST